MPKNDDVVHAVHLEEMKVFLHSSSDVVLLRARTSQPEDIWYSLLEHALTFERLAAEEQDPNCPPIHARMIRESMRHQADQVANLGVHQGGTWAGRSAGSPAVGQALRRRLAFFVALVAVFLPTVLRRALD